MILVLLECNGCCECDRIGGTSRTMPCRSGKCVMEEHGNYKTIYYQ